MNGQAFLDALRDDHETALSRLGSSKSLYALTGGEMDAAHVTRAAADEATIAARTFDAWAQDEDTEAAADLFADVAETSRAHAERVEPDDYEPVDSLRVYAHCDSVEGTVERLAALAAARLVTGKTVEQMVGFFVGDADPTTANTFRDLRGDVETQRDDAAELLADTCTDDDEWDRAREAADAVVEVAYDDYVDTLEGMGVKPKNVC
jgi:Asp-tRNA(Asn)/Glu-tRNA(Gln) amidotransferase C subunit